MLAYDTDTADVVIIGGGIMGAAVAYELMRAGAKDVLLLDEHATAEGTSWHTPGFMGTVRITRTGDLMAQDSVALWEAMAERHGKDCGWYRTGGLRVAATDLRAAELAAMAAQAQALGIECTVGGGELAAAMHPGLFVDDLQLVVHTPDEGWVDAFVMTRTLLREAHELGLRVLTGTRVTGFETVSGRVTGMKTWRGSISAGHVVLAAGCASPSLAATVGVHIPAQNFLARATVLSQPPGQPREFPAVRDNDGLSYFRSDPEGVVVGGDLAHPELTDDPDPLGTPRINIATGKAAMRGQVDAASARYPALKSSSILKVVRGPELFSADGECILGPSGIDGLTLATAGSGHGVAFAGGIGKAVAQLVVRDASDLDISEYALARFEGQDLTRDSIIARAQNEYVNYLSVRPWLVDGQTASMAS